MSYDALRAMVKDVVQTTRVTDMHTHLFPPSFAELQLSGANNVLTYHYLIAEAFRMSDEPYESFWEMDRASQAEWIWDKLFRQSTPASEATSGVVQIAKAFGVHLKSQGLSGLREASMAEASEEYVNHVLDLAGVERLVMTNDPFDPVERACWERSPILNPRFYAALRLDVLVNDAESAVLQLVQLGYKVSPELNQADCDEISRFLEDWFEKISPIYLAFSASDSFDFPEDSHRGKLMETVILPFCKRHKLPLALMIGARRQVNPALRSAGDSTAKASVTSIERLCQLYPDNKFLVTLLSRENQHELAVAARKFRNLMPFGCWWFVNTDSLIDEITRMRFELLGSTFIPQHSDARVLEHVIYKWQRARAMICDVLIDKYIALTELGWDICREDVERDVNRLCNDNFWTFVRK